MIATTVLLILTSANVGGELAARRRRCGKNCRWTTQIHGSWRFDYVCLDVYYNASSCICQFDCTIDLKNTFKVVKKNCFFKKRNYLKIITIISGIKDHTYSIF